MTDHTARAALIGLGMVAPTYGDAIAKSEAVTLGPVFARSADARRGFLDAHPGLGAVEAESVAAIADDDSVDFVILTTPPNARAEIIDVLSRAGKPILMEKPVERDLAAATALVEICETRDVPLGIMLQHRARPVVAELRGVMARLGTLRAVEVTVPWWRGQSYYDEPGRGTYARDGGGVMISQAIHTMDLMLSLTGPAVEVTAMAGTTGFHEMEAEDFVSAGLRFENGALGQLFAATASYPGAGEVITLHGALGSARLEAGRLHLSWQDGGTEVLGTAAASGAGADPMAFTSDWHRTVIEDFAGAVREGRAPMITGRSALGVHALIAALEQSAREGRRVAL
ncbi:MAG: Gfo/Idh/MocA family oxidoreductase [Silicimonas sp.]|nr:Gfo/Idh/MocA family oxidoreductase [Silicimonas sp.]